MSVNHKKALDEIKKRLAQEADENYRRQIEKLVPGIRTIGVRVPVIRVLATNFATQHKDWDFPTICDLLDLICKGRSRDEMLFGIFLVAQHRKELPTLPWVRIIAWLQAVDNWETCDQLAANIAAPALAKHADKAKNLKALALKKNHWQRRFAAATATALNQKGRKEWQIAFEVCALLISDQEPMVQKAVAWALREITKDNEEKVFSFLQTHKAKIPAKVLREASEKISEAKRKVLLA